MRSVLKYSWIIILCGLIIYGAIVIRNEWKRKLIHTHGEIVEVTIEELDCPRKIMSFRFGSEKYHKQIDARTCVLFNQGQKIKLKHSQQYTDTFLYLNEINPNLFILGGLEMALGILGLLSNWPLIRTRQA